MSGGEKTRERYDSAARHNNYKGEEKIIGNVNARTR